MNALVSILKKTWTTVWKTIVFVAIWGVLYAPAVLLLTAGAEAGGSLSPESRVYLEFFGAISVLAAGWVMTRFADRRPFLSLGFEPSGIFKDLAAGLVIGGAMILLALTVLWVPGWLTTGPGDDFSAPILVLAGSGLLLNSITQEVLVRGYVLQTIRYQFGGATALIGSALFFTALHAGAFVEGGLIPGLNLFLAGILLGMAYMATGNLWLPVMLHFVWNFLQGPVLGINVSGQDLGGGWELIQLQGPPSMTGGSFGLEGGLAATLATVAGIVVIWLFRDSTSKTVTTKPQAAA